MVVLELKVQMEFSGGWGPTSPVRDGSEDRPRTFGNRWGFRGGSGGRGRGTSTTSLQLLPFFTFVLDPTPVGEGRSEGSGFISLRSPISPIPNRCRSPRAYGLHPPYLFR